ncbi:MAG: hypothetical protein ACI9FD_000970, partial [Gammaproteobacteria bacterium]
LHARLECELDEAISKGNNLKYTSIISLTEYWQ